jgi:type II secretory pathway pseudopilin PulG
MIELVIVIVIIGIIAAIAIPRFSRAGQTSAFNATQSTWIAYEKQMFLYEATYATFPASGRAGVFDPCMSEFIRETNWVTPPPIGGKWLWTNDAGGAMGVGIEDAANPTALWQQFDSTFDDGDLRAGVLQVAGGNFYRLLADRSAGGATAANGEGVTAEELP